MPKDYNKPKAEQHTKELANKQKNKYKMLKDAITSNKIAPVPVMGSTYTTSNTSTSSSTLPNITGQWTTGHQAFQQPQWQPGPQPYDQGMTEDYAEDADEIAQLLGVPEGGSGILITGKSGKTYSLLAIIKSHLDLMQQLHVLAVHTTRLIP